MSKLQLNRQDGEKGSTNVLVWNEAEREAFSKLKSVLAARLDLFRFDPDIPFIMDCDASDRAIGAVLQQYQEIDGKRSSVPVGFFSRKLGKSQLNSTLPGKGDLRHCECSKEMGKLDQLAEGDD